MIDVTYNPWIAAWFAVRKNPKTDARLFGFKMSSNSTLKEKPDIHLWEKRLDLPWPSPKANVAHPNRLNLSCESQDYEVQLSKYKDMIEYKLWANRAFIWASPQLFGRITAQEGAFLLGGTPTGRIIYRRNQKNENSRLKITEVRTATSLAVRRCNLKSIEECTGDEFIDAYSIRISSEAIPEILEYVENNKGIRVSKMFPDFSGFQEYRSNELFDDGANIIEFAKNVQKSAGNNLCSCPHS